MCNKQTNKMKTNNKLCVKLKSPSGEKFEVIFDTSYYPDLTELLVKNALEDHKVINWKLKRVVFIS
jgi:hypothetical protein